MPVHPLCQMASGAGALSTRISNTRYGALFRRRWPSIVPPHRRYLLPFQRPDPLPIFHPVICHTGWSVRFVLKKCEADR
ncbi:hypothetical protein EJP617_05530 [Erwinia sp. Ejp617]|nr:hypothetical protein EJP617_05530 [Erwinia sp. Ejp617]